jgi:TonB family protein
VVQIEIHEKFASQMKNQKQIVREALLPDSLKVRENDDPLRFWSNQTQRVKKQTRAARLGLTENRFHSSQKSAQQETEQRQQRNLLESDEILQAAKAARGKGFPVLGSQGVSTVGENLPEDVQIGSFTALNTDRYLYYSFYSRVEGLIRYRWESSVERELESTPKERLAANIRSRWVTHMEVLLNSKGEFLKAMIMKQSGIPGFDQAAAQAFAQARYFPNPPKEMVEEDGFIHLKYSFTVVYDPQLMARPSSP